MEPELNKTKVHVVFLFQSQGVIEICFPHHFSHLDVLSAEAAPLPQSVTPSQPPDPPSFRQHAGSQLFRRSTYTSS